MSDHTGDPGCVRITFERMADRRPVETLVERDDVAVFRMRGPAAAPTGRTIWCTRWSSRTSG